jgi:CheY-like chemotaxis protein
MITNLAVNARDAMPTGGTLSIRLSLLNLQPDETPPCLEMPPGEWTVLSVSDTGTGISSEVRPHLFEPFFTTKEVGEGTGLGLAQVYGIVKQHEGFINVESQVGQGTTFTIYLPAVVVKRETGGKEVPEKIPYGHGETVLLVEDEPAVLEVGEMILEELGYRVLTASNGQQALSTYAEQKEEIDLVLTDMVMPKMDGMALYQALKAYTPEVKVIVITGYPLGGEAHQVLTQGILDWVQKPLTVTRLAQVVSQALHKTGDIKSL